MILQCVTYSISQGAIINPNYYINTDNLPITGLDPDYKVYGYYIPYAEPEYDSRGWTLIITKTMIDSPHPIYGSNLLTYEVTYSLQRKSDEELYLAVDNAETNANEQLLPAIASTSKRQRSIKLLHKKSNGFTLTQDETDFLDLMDEYADAMDDNADNADSMKDYIEANPTLVPDFDAGWTTSL